MTFSSRLPILFLLVCSLFSTSLFSQNAFQKLYGEAGSTIGNDLLVLPNGDYLVGGAQVGEVLGSPAHPTLYRLAPNGSVIWQKSYPTPVDGVIEKVILANNGGYLALGFYRLGGIAERLMVLKTDVDGNLQWSRRLGFEGLGAQILPLPDGYLICGAQNGDPIGAFDGFFLKINNQGELDWTRTYGIPQQGYSFQDVVRQGDKLYTVGSHIDFSANPPVSSCALYVLSLVNGNVYFINEYPAAGGQSASLSTILPLADGNFRASGQTLLDTPDGPRPAEVVMTLDPDGNVLSSDILYGTDDNVSAQHMQNTADGGFILCGNIETGVDKRQSLLLRSNADMSQLEAFQYSQNINLSDFNKCLPAADGGMLALGAFIPLLNVQDTTVVHFMQLTRTNADGVIESCCIQPVAMSKAAFPVETVSIAIGTREFAQTDLALSLQTESRTLSVGDYCPHVTIERTENIDFCAGESVVIDGVIYDQPGTVIDTILSANACDTAVTYVLSLLPQPAREVSLEFCAGESVEIDGVSYDQPGTVVITVPAQTGCDTTVTYHLSLLPQPTREVSLEFCAGESVEINGVSYDQPGTVVDTLAAQTGCDTLVFYQLSYITLPQPSQVTVQCPASVVVQAPAGGSSAVVNYNLPTAATDCPCGTVSLELEQGFLSDNSFPLGPTQVCYQAADECGNSSSCCFAVTVEATGVETACDLKITPCTRFEILGIFQNSAGEKRYRIRITNTCTSALNYVAFQLPDGLTAGWPVNASTYTAPSGRTYSVRNASAAPFHSIRFKAQGTGIAGGQSDIFEYSLPAQADPDYVLTAVRLESGAWYEAHLNVFGCPVQTLVDRPTERASDGSQALQPGFYPNPATDILHVNLLRWAGQTVRIQVFDALGRQVIDRAESAGATPLQLDLSGLQTGGVFVLVVRDDKGAQPLGRFLRL